MSTATTRLRRAGAGGLAAAVIAGTLLASGGIASAATAGGVLTAASQTSVNPGTNLAVGNLTLSIKNATWGPGDYMTVTLPSSCGAPGQSVGFASAPTIAVSGPTTTAGGTTAGTSGATTPTFTSALSSSSAACTALNVKDTLTITLTNAASGGSTSDFFNFAISNIKYNVDSGVPAGAVTVNAAGYTSGTTTPATWTSSASNATVVKAGFTVSPVTAVLPTGAAISGVKVGTATFKEVTAGTIFPAGASTAASITLSGTGNAFTAGITPTITASAGLTITKLASTAVNHYDFTVTTPATLSGPATVTVSGLTATVAATSSVKGTQISLTPTPAAAGAAQPAINVVDYGKRIGGTDRYATAANLFVAGGFGGGPAVLASGATFPDALSANYLAGQLHTGTLLTTATALPSVTLNTIINQHVDTVYIVGGTGAVSQAIENQIAATHVGNSPLAPFINVVRLGGSDRYATNKIVNEYQFTSQSVALMATGANFADALSVGPAAYRLGFPLILTDGNSLSAAAASQLTDFGVSTVVIAGGTGAVSTAVENTLKGMGITVARLAGADRTETAAQVATWLVDGITATGVTGPQGFGVGTVHIANGLDFPDALAAGPVAGETNTVIQLTGSPTSLGAGIPDFLGTQTVGASPTAVNTLNALGLTGAVSPAVMQAAAASIG